VAGLIGAAAVILIVKTTWTGGVPQVQVVSENFPDWKSWCLLGGAFVAGYWGKVNPIYVILAGAVLGLLLY
jgi:chromate transport protein ChrA